MPDVQRETQQDTQDESNPEQLPPEALTPHPKNSEVYDTTVSDRFVADIRENGVEQTMKVTSASHFAEGTVIISGHRRRRGAVQAGLDSVPVEWLSYDSPEAEVAGLHRHNDYRDLKFSERMSMADDLWDLHDAGHQTFGDTNKEIRQSIGDRTGIGSHESYRKAKAVWDAALEGDPEAEEYVEAIDTGDRSIHNAYAELRTDSEAAGAVGEAMGEDETGDDTHQTFGDSGGDGRVIDNPTDESDYYVSLRRVVEWYNDENGTDLATDKDGILRSAAMIASGQGGR